MGLAALLCGLFYGAFFLSVWQKEERNRALERLSVRGMERLLADLRGESCACGECCDCESSVSEGLFDFYAATHTGYEDG